MKGVNYGDRNMKMILIEDCCEILDSKRIPITAKNRIPGPYPYYGANGIQDYVDNYIFDDELVLLAEDGGNFGSTEKPIAYRVSGKCWVNNHAHVLKPRKGIDVDYLCYSLMFYDTNGLVNGATRQKLTQSTLKKMSIPKRTVKQQLQIVQELNTIKKLITARKQELQKLDDLIKARFVEMFGTLHDNKKGFAVVTIEKVCSLIKDGTHQTPQYTEDKEEGYKFLSSKDVMTQKIDWTDIKYIPAELHEKLYASIKPQRNDILMSKNGVNYGVAAVNDTDEVFDIYVSLALLRPKPMIDPVFFRCVINNHETKRQFDSSIKGIGVPNLHLGEIKKTKIILQPLELQKEFVSFVAQVDKSKLLSGCRLFHSWAPENRDKPKHVGVPQRKTKVLRGCQRQQ